MKPTVLVTGAAGFVGTHFCRYLVANGWQVAGLALQGQSIIADAAAYFGDVSDATVVRRVVDAVQPRFIVHLAAQSSVAASAAGQGAARTIGSNVSASPAVIDALAEAPGTRLLLIGSAEEYGARSEAAGPISEETELAPLNAYASSKVCQEVLAAQYIRTANVDVVLTRSFNHTGAGQAPHFLVPSLVDRARALPARGGVLSIGNGEVVRDFLDVGDVVAAYAALLERGVTGTVYNVCSGLGLTVREIAQLVLDTVGVSATIESRPGLRRPTDAPYLVGQNDRLTSHTGWTPRSSLAAAVAAVAAAAG